MRLSDEADMPNFLFGSAATSLDSTKIDMPKQLNHRFTCMSKGCRLESLENLTDEIMFSRSDMELQTPSTGQNEGFRI